MDNTEKLVASLRSTYVDGVVEDLEAEELRIVVAAQLQDLVNGHVGLRVRLEVVHDTVCVLHLWAENEKLEWLESRGARLQSGTLHLTIVHLRLLTSAGLLPENIAWVTIWRAFALFSSNGVEKSSKILPGSAACSDCCC